MQPLSLKISFLEAAFYRSRAARDLECLESSYLGASYQLEQLAAQQRAFS